MIVTNVIFPKLQPIIFPAIRPSLLVYDSFTRNDNTNNMRYTDTGQLWDFKIEEATTKAMFGISNNQAYVSSSGDGATDIFLKYPLSTSDIIINCDCKWVTSGNIGVAFNGNGALTKASSRHFVARFEAATVGLFKWTGAALSAISSVAFSPVDGQTYKLKVISIGTNKKVFIDGVKYIDVNDNSIFGNYVGIRDGNGTGTAPNKRWDNFSVETS